MKMGIEKYLEIINMVFRIINIMVNSWIIGVFVKPFLNEKRKAKWVCVSYLSAMVVLYFVPYVFSGTSAYGIGIVISFAVCGLTDRYNILQKIFLAVTAFLIRWIAAGIVLEPWNGVWALTTRQVMESSQGVQVGMFLFVEALHVILENLAFYFMVRLIHKVYLQKKEIMNRKELFLLLSPYLAIVSGYFFVNFLAEVYEKDTKYYIWNTHMGYRGFSVLYQIISFLAIVAGIMSYQWIKAAQEDELQRAVIAEQIKDMKNHVDKVEELYQGIRGMKHDINNHILVLEELLEKGNKKEAGEYLSDMRQDYEDSGFSVKTGNPVTDVIISEKAKEAQEKGMEFTCRFGFPETSNVPTYDISVILGNTLSNAMEAAENSNEKKVMVSSAMKNQIYFIDVKNSFDGVLDIDEDTGLPPTTKAKSEGHGYGMRNVKKVAEKYYGAVEIKPEDGWIRTTVMMVLPM